MLPFSPGLLSLQMDQEHSQADTNDRNGGGGSGGSIRLAGIIY